MANTHFGTWNSKSDIISGLAGGLPLTVFDKAMENTIVISPFREFMATSSHLDTSSNPRVLQLGVFGKADKVTKVDACMASYYISSQAAFSFLLFYFSIKWFY